MENHKKVWLSISNKYKEYSPIHLLLENINIINKTTKVYTNINFVYLYCKYKNIQITFTNSSISTTTSIIKDCNEVFFICENHIEEDDDLVKIYNISNKLKKSVSIISQ